MKGFINRMAFLILSLWLANLDFDIGVRCSLYPVSYWGTLVYLPTSGPEVEDEDESGSDDEESRHGKKRRLGDGSLM